MASSSSSSSFHIRRYHVFPSFHGEDVRRGFLSHLHYHFASKGIMTFNDQKIERGHTIGPELVRAIRESRVSIVVLSKRYASSSWCLDELLEILKCKEDDGQIVLTIFYQVDPSDVRKQRGDFGSAFEITCQGKPEEVKLRWSNALAHVATIAGEHSLHWPNETEMIQKIATDVSNKLNLTPLRDFDGMVGLEAHLTKLHSLLWLGCDDAKPKMIGIWGLAGIGKTTIARALFNRLSSSFQLNCFMDNLKGSFKSVMDVDDYYSKLSLQTQLLSKILNQEDMKTYDLGAIKEWLQDQRVLIILDDVDDLEQLEALAKELSWFGSGSRIIVTTEDNKILKAHGIQDIYHVDYPSEKEALEILCRSAFKQSSVPYGFEELANKVAAFCGKLPLALCVVGSSLHGETKYEWELQLSRIKASLDGKIETILKVGYDRFNLDVGNGLKLLADKSLVHISTDGRIVMHHYLLQKLGRQIVLERQFLIEAAEIRDVLTNKTGTGSVIGISFDTSKIGKVSVSKGAFEGMCNLQFLRIYSSLFGGEGTLQIPKSMKYLPENLKLLHWEHYPRKSRLPLRFQPERLVELHMPHSNLEGGIKPLPNLKSIDLSFSSRLKEIPNLSNATNLETLTLVRCTSLTELPFSISNLHKLSKLKMRVCEKLRVIPTNINLASLEEVDMNYCSQLSSFPDISSNIKTLGVGNTKIEDVPPSVAGCWSRLDCLEIGSRSLNRLTHAPHSITWLDLSNSNIKRIPDCVISLPHLKELIVENCQKLVTIPALPPSLKSLNANECVSLERVCFYFHNPTKILTFYNCLKLDEEARRGITQQSIHDYICLPGKKIPAEFTQKATGKSITIPLATGTLSASSRFKACFLISPTMGYQGYLYISCSLRSKGGVTDYNCNSVRLSDMAPRSEHLFIFDDLFGQRYRWHKVDVTMSEIILEFSSIDKIIECGVQIMTEEAEGSSSSELDNFETEISRSQVDNYETESSRLAAAAKVEMVMETMKQKVSSSLKLKISKPVNIGFRIWVRKLGLKEKKMNTKEQNSRGVS
ncbi:unnamed protein product [Arabidopsis lyrata]|nr:unnamed protein product [Arabidopsis lyrata]